MMYLRKFKRNDSLKVQESSLKMNWMLVFCMAKTIFFKLDTRFD